MSQSFDKSLRQLTTGREILLALKVFGPLSSHSIAYVLGGASAAKVRFAIERLLKLKLIEQISYRFEARLGSYYYFDSSVIRRVIVADLLDCEPDDLRLECIRYKELPHEQRCARTQYSLIQMFPEARLYRDYQLDRLNISEKVFPNLSAERRIYPDILLHTVSEHRKHSECFIAFEIEQSLKSKKRIMEKLQLYATSSLLDGVMYISTASQITESIRNIYNSQTLQKNLRIKHYGVNFLLFQQQEVEDKDLFDFAINSAGQRVDLRSWMTLLMRTRNTERRNSQFEVDDQKVIAERKEF